MPKVINRTLLLVSLIMVSLLYLYHNTHHQKGRDTHQVKCNGLAVPLFPPNTLTPALLTSEDKLYTQECFESILTKVAKNTNKPLVILITGRGMHPWKSINKQLLLKLEKQYNVNALIFTWPSWCGIRCLPFAQARHSAEIFLKLLYAIAHTINRNQQKKQIVTLLSHSMGSAVLEGVSTHSLEALPHNLVNNILIDASSSSQQGHTAWLQKLTFTKHLFIISNQGDAALKCLESDSPHFGLTKIFCKDFKLSPRLGRWGAEKNYQKNSVYNVHYIDFTEELGDRHKYYIDQREKSTKVFNFYYAVFHGYPVNLHDTDQTLP